MTQLYGHKWASREGMPKTEAGHFAPNFLFWCKRTEHLNDEQWRRGFDQLEYLVRDAARCGDEAWPPSYAEFTMYCEKPSGSQAHRYFARSLPEPESMKEKRHKQAKHYIERLKNIFEE